MGIKGMENERKERDRRKKELEKILKTREIRFCVELLIDDNGTGAAVRAGYSEKSARNTAYKLLQRPEIVEYKIIIAKEAYENIGIVPEVIALRINEIQNRCMQKVPVMEWKSETRQYEETGKWTFDAKNALAAAKLMGDSIGMFGKKQEQKNKEEKVDITVSIANSLDEKEEGKK